MLYGLALLLGLTLTAAQGAAAAELANGAIDGLRCTPALEGYHVEVDARGAHAGAAVEVIDALGESHRLPLGAPGARTVSVTLAAPAVAASLDPGGPDADPFDDHFPRKLTVTLWDEAPRDAYLLRYFPGLTFKQGPAPVRPRGAPMMPPAQGPMGLGLGLEGRRPGEHGWQVLANFGASPFAPSLVPRFSLHGYVLPHPNWGVDADVGLEPSGALSTELGTSLITWDASGPASASPALAHQLRLAVGSPVPQETLPTAPYATLSLYRDDLPTLGLSSHASLFGRLGGGWRAILDAQRTQGFGPDLALRLNGSVGTSMGVAPADRVYAGLVSQAPAPTAGRAFARATLLAPLARGLDMSWGAATLAQVEGGLFLEAARTWGTEATLGGLGAEVTLVQDTIFGIPLALNMGYAVPLGPSPWPGRFYITTTDAFFARQPR